MDFHDFALSFEMAGKLSIQPPMYVRTIEPREGVAPGERRAKGRADHSKRIETLRLWNLLSGTRNCRKKLLCGARIVFSTLATSISRPCTSPPCPPCAHASPPMSAFTVASSGASNLKQRTASEGKCASKRLFSLPRCVCRARNGQTVLALLTP